LSSCAYLSWYRQCIIYESFGVQTRPKKIYNKRLLRQKWLLFKNIFCFEYLFIVSLSLLYYHFFPFSFSPEKTTRLNSKKKKKKTQPNEMINRRTSNIKKPLFSKRIVSLSFYFSFFRTKPSSSSSSPTNLRRPSPTDLRSHRIWRTIFQPCRHTRIWIGRSRVSWSASLYRRRMWRRYVIRRERFLLRNGTFNRWSVRLRFAVIFMVNFMIWLSFFGLVEMLRILIISLWEIM